MTGRTEDIDIEPPVKPQSPQQQSEDGSPASGKTREERMAEAIARAEERRKQTCLIEYVPPVNFEAQLDCVKQVPFESLIRKSPYAALKPTAQTDAICIDFNKNVKEHVIVDAGARTGERIEPGVYLMAHRNRVPEMAVGRGQRLTLKMTGGYTETGYLGGADGRFRQTDPLLGAFGSYILNVPQGKIARIWLGNTPVFYGEGAHVIHDPLLRAGTEGGSFIKDMADQYVAHGTLHILRVPVGKYACVTVDTHAMLLPYRKEPYCFDTPLFEFARLVDEGHPVIEHGPLHLIRIPAGSVGTAWIGSKPLLLEYREEPYFFDDPLFRFEKRTANAAFFDNQTKHLKHGAINRLRPGVNGDLEVAVIQCDGALEFIEHATVIDNPNWAVLGFLNNGLQTHIFPSRQTREERRRENPQATIEEITYEPMTTRDSLKVGLKLLVAFQVCDPHRVMRRLRLTDIISHVENLAVSDMARAVQNSTSQNFLHASDTQPQPIDETASETASTVQQPSENSIADRVRTQLAEHLEDCGLKLVRFNVEEAKVLDEQLAKEMAKQALVAATAHAQQAVITQKAAVAKSNAELEAMARRVQQDQENAIHVSAAQAELEAQRLKAQAILVLAEAEQKAQELRGEQYSKFPELLQLEIARLQMDALRGSSVTLVSSELGQTPFGASNAFRMSEVTGTRPGNQ